MSTINQKKVPILDMSRGALAEEVSVQLGKVAENVMDPNTDYKAARKLIITLEFKTDETREFTKVTAKTNVKLANSKPVTTQIAFGEDTNGELCAVELSMNVPGQVGVDGSEEPANNVFAINCHKA